VAFVIYRFSVIKNQNPRPLQKIEGVYTFNFATVSIHYWLILL